MRVKDKVELYRELVPLHEAAAVAYHIITERPVPLKDPHALEEVRGLVAIALSTVAPVLQQVDGSAAPLSAAEIDERLFTRGRPALLDGLCMRRVDLLRAVETLREAHVAFDRAYVLESIRKLS
jgi:hypothetical protein